MIGVTLSATLGGETSLNLTLTGAVATARVHEDVHAWVLQSTAGGYGVVVKATSSTPVTGTAVAVKLSLTTSDETAVSISGAGANVFNDTSGSVTSARVSGSILTATAPNGSIEVTALSGLPLGDTGWVLSATVTTVDVGVTVGGQGVAVTLTFDEAAASNTAGGDTSAVVDDGSDLCGGVRAADGSCASLVTPIQVLGWHTGGMTATVVTAKFGVGVGKATSLSLEASVAINTSNTTVTGSVAGAATKVAGSGLLVQASADESLSAIAVAATVGITAAAGAAGATVDLTGAAAVATNTTSGTLTAEIDGATVIAGTGGVQVTAYAGPETRTITTTAVAASLMCHRYLGEPGGRGVARRGRGHRQLGGNRPRADHRWRHGHLGRHAAGAGHLARIRRHHGRLRHCRRLGHRRRRRRHTDRGCSGRGQLGARGRRSFRARFNGDSHRDRCHRHLFGDGGR